MSAAAKAEILKSLNLLGPGSLYFKVTADVTYAGGKGWVGFSNPNFTGAVVDAQFTPPVDEKNKWALIGIKSEAKGRKYLVDCLVATNGIDEGPYKIWRNEQLLQTSAPNSNHLIFLVETMDDYWYMFKITGGPTWYLSSCEVTRF